MSGVLWEEYMNEYTKPYGNLTKAKVLLIGHDPNLQNSKKLPEYCFFADYTKLKHRPKESGDGKRYDLAKSVFRHVKFLTSGKIKEDEIYLTNLCNKKLPRPKLYEFDMSEFYISRSNAEEGLADIERILANSNIKVILSSSLQVNYWLQVLGFYRYSDEFIKNAEPIPWCAANDCYTPLHRALGHKGLFYNICGEKFITSTNHIIFPILHIKCIGKDKIMNVYEPKLKKCKEVINTLDI